MNLWTIPNGLTVVRLTIGFWFVAMVVKQPDKLYELHWWAFYLALCAFVTDFLDGWIAKKWTSQQSRFGAHLDPPADKLAVIGYMLFLYMSGVAYGTLEFFCFTIIAAREVIMWVKRLVVGADKLPVNSFGQWKTAAQMTTLIAYGLIPLFSWMYMIAVPLLLVALVLTVLSLALYFLPEYGKSTA